MSSKRLRGFERGKIGPVNGNDHIGGNYAAALNLEASLPNFFPESSRTDLGVFLDFGNVWGVDYDASLDESNKIRSSAGVYQLVFTNRPNDICIFTKSLKSIYR